MLDPIDTLARTFSGYVVAASSELAAESGESDPLVSLADAGFIASLDVETGMHAAFIETFGREPAAHDAAAMADALALAKRERFFA